MITSPLRWLLYVYVSILCISVSLLMQLHCIRRRLKWTCCAGRTVLTVRTVGSGESAALPIVKVVHLTRVYCARCRCRVTSRPVLWEPLITIDLPPGSPVTVQTSTFRFLHHIVQYRHQAIKFGALLRPDANNSLAVLLYQVCLQREIREGFQSLLLFRACWKVVWMVYYTCAFSLSYALYDPISCQNLFVLNQHNMAILQTILVYLHKYYNVLQLC